MEKIISTVSNINLTNSHSGKEGLEIANHMAPDAIILDINLSDISGYQVAKVLRGSPETENIPIIAVSANALIDTETLDRNRIFNDYIAKPIDIPKFLSALKKVL